MRKRITSFMFFFMTYLFYLPLIGVGIESEYEDYQVIDKLNLKWQINTVRGYEKGIDRISMVSKYEGGDKEYIQGLEIIVSWDSELRQTKCEISLSAIFSTDNFIEDVPFTLLGATKIYYLGSTFKDSLSLEIPPNSKSEKKWYISTKVRGIANGIMIGVPNRGTLPKNDSFYCYVEELKRKGE